MIAATTSFTTVSDMTLYAQCPGCGRGFTFDTATAALAAVVDASHGGPQVRRCFLHTCPACRRAVRVSAALATPAADHTPRESS